MELISFGKRLKQIRENLNLSQVKLAHRLGYDNKRISYLENIGDKRGVYLSWIKKFAEKLKLLQIGFYYNDKGNWVLDNLNSEKFWKGTHKNYVGEILKKYRIKKGLQQKELEEKTGISYQMISKYETGRGQPLSKTLEDICKSLDITPSYLLEKLVNFDEEDYKILERARVILEQYVILCNDKKEIRNMIIEAQKLESVIRDLKIKYNLMRERVIFHK